MTTKNWVNNKYVAFHITKSKYLGSILKRGLLSREFLGNSGLGSSYGTHFQPYDEISLYSAGGDYLDFSYKKGLTRKSVERMCKEDFERIFIALNGHGNIRIDGKQISDFDGETYYSMKRTLLDVLEGVGCSPDNLAKTRDEVILVIDTKQKKRIFPHRRMYGFEICVKDRIPPEEIIDDVK